MRSASDARFGVTGVSRRRFCRPPPQHWPPFRSAFPRLQTRQEAAQTPVEKRLKCGELSIR
jgi:hypothetical protein